MPLTSSSGVTLTHSLGISSDVCILGGASPKLQEQTECPAVFGHGTCQVALSLRLPPQEQGLHLVHPCICSTSNSTSHDRGSERFTEFTQSLRRPRENHTSSLLIYKRQLLFPQDTYPMHSENLCLSIGPLAR